LLDETDKRILRALANIAIDENPSEHHIAKKTYNSKLKPKELSTPTVRRRLPNLVKKGFVKYLGRGKQRSQKHRLELKGLFYLLSYEKGLTDFEIMNVAKATIDGLPIKRKKKSLLKMVVPERVAKETVDIVDEVKHKINFDFFDENYVSEMFFDTLFVHCMKIAADIATNSEKTQHTHGQDEAKGVLRALQSNPWLYKGVALTLKTSLEYYREQKRKTAIQYRECKKMWKTWNRILS